MDESMEAYSARMQYWAAHDRVPPTANVAALTEAEALRAQVAASQAREVALREALESARDYFDARADTEDGTDSRPVPNAAMRELSECDAALSAPTDTAALREFGLRVIAESDKWGEDLPESIVDRILGGS